MFAKAIFICDDVRLEANGTMTLVGVHGERLLAGGLRGAPELRYRHQLRRINDRERFDHPFFEEPHDPSADEHNFVFGEGELTLPGDGEYELITEVEVGGSRRNATARSFRYRFEILRRQ